MNNLKNLLFSRGITIELDEEFDFSRRSTIGTGGKATALFPKTLKETVEVIDLLDEEEIPFLPLGNLSNVLPPDGDFEKVVLSTTRLNGMEFSNGVFVEAGVKANRFLDECEKQGYTGAEFLAGIPCTLGGAVYMNAGAGGRYISDIVEKVLVYRGKKLRLLPRSACRFSYKNSRFMQDDSVVLGVELSLKKCDEETVRLNKSAALQLRKNLPNGRSMGCVFKNPLGDSAGRLIESAGLKGLRIGGAIVSELHANFIINDRKATSADILQLISMVKNAVYSQYKVALEEEIRILT